MLALGNPRAIASSTRGSELHADLNRVFTDARLADAAETSYEMRRARELAPLLASADYLVDLHATNKPSEAFLVVAGDTPKHRELCRFFACEKILHVPETLVSGTTVGLVDRHRGAGICFESGWLGDLSRVGEMRRSVEAILRHAGLLAPAGAPALQDGQQLFVLTDAITLTDAGFAFAEGRGQRSFEPFAAGDLLGHHGAAPLTAPYDGILMFPKVPELWRVGSPVGFLAREGTL
jgi:succinylglutamate desuccinylase